MLDGFYTMDPGQALIVDDFTLTSIPEPASIVLIGAAMVGFFSLRRPRN
jgi:hypothetical protein